MVNAPPTQKNGLKGWLEEWCRKEGLSLRAVASRTGLSHTTVADILKSGKASPETVRKLAEAFAEEGGDHQRLALEDKLLVLAGCRSERPEEALSVPMACLLDRLSQFDEAQLKIMERFADFLNEERKKE